MEISPHLAEEGYTLETALAHVAPHHKDLLCYIELADFFEHPMLTGIPCVDGDVSVSVHYAVPYGLARNSLEEHIGHALLGLDVGHFVVHEVRSLMIRAIYDEDFFLYIDCNPNTSTIASNVLENNTLSDSSSDFPAMRGMLSCFECMVWATKGIYDLTQKFLRDSAYALSEIGYRL
jgi:hypothetical protein